jgi:hypothetical protein
MSKPKNKSLFKKTKEVVRQFNSDGAIIILQKKNNKGCKIAQFSLNHEEIRGNLCIASYYNEKIEIEKQLCIVQKLKV